MSDIGISQQYPDYSSAPVDSYNSLKSALGKLKIRSQLHSYAGGLAAWIASMSLLLIGWFLLGGVFRLPPALRVPLILIWIAGAVWVGYRFIFKTLVRRTSIQQMAFRIEQCHPEMQDRLISSLQLWPELQEDKYGYSKDFIVRVVEEASESMGKIDRSKVLANDRKKSRRAGIIMAGTLLPLIALIALYPATFANSINTFVHPLEGGSQPITIEITRVLPGDHSLQPGGSVDISAEATGPAPPDAVLHHKTENGKWSTISLQGRETTEGDGEKAVFATTLQNIKESLEYYVSVADVRSQQYSITVIHKPIIHSLQLELQYPRYTGLSPQTLDADAGNIIAPPGTRVMITAESSKDIASAFVVFDDETRARLEAKEPRKMSGSFLVQRSGRYHISITDTDGQWNPDPVKYSINALADQPPQVSILQPGQDVEMGEDMKIALQIEVQDDYGVASASLHYQIEGQDDKYTIPLGSFDSPQSIAILEYLWDISPLPLFPEDVISYYAEAMDADNISGPNIGRSTVYTARFPSVYELYGEIETEQEAQQLEMDNIRSQQEEVKDMVDELVSELKKEKELDWAGKKELERVEELQQEIQKQAEELAQELSKTVEKAEKNPLIGLEALQKLQELRNLMDELATDEMKQIMQKLSESLKDVNPSQQQKDLMAASFKQEEFIEKLDRMIDLFKKMQLQQSLEAAANQAEELVKQQTETLEQTEQLAERMDDSKQCESESKTLADRENRIKEQAEKLLEDIEELAKKMQESAPKIGDFLEQSAEKAKKGKMTEQLQQAASELGNCCPNASQSCQRNALSQMSQLQNELQSAQEAMEGEDATEIIAALSSAVRSSLYLSHRHEEIMQATSAFDGEAENMLPKEKEIMDSLAADEIDLSEGAGKVSNQLKELSHKSATVSPELVWNMERVADGLNRSAAAMEDKLPALVGPIQKNTLAELNSAIEDMLDSMDQMSSQSMSSSGMESYMEQLRQLADQQSRLNESTQGTDSMRRRQGTTPSVQEMLEKLAIEQSLIKEAAERLGEKLDKMQEVLGRMDEVGKEMQEVENDLRRGNLDRNTIDKQRRILTRLLEYEKSMKKQDLSKKREARAGRDYTIEQPASALPDDATLIRKQLDTMSSPAIQRQWPMQYRRLIKMYYKALSNTKSVPNVEID